MSNVTWIAAYNCILSRSLTPRLGGTANGKANSLCITASLLVALRGRANPYKMMSLLWLTVLYILSGFCSRAKPAYDLHHPSTEMVDPYLTPSYINVIWNCARVLNIGFHEPRASRGRYSIPILGCSSTLEFEVVVEELFLVKCTGHVRHLLSPSTTTFCTGKVSLLIKGTGVLGTVINKRSTS